MARRRRGKSSKCALRRGERGAALVIAMLVAVSAAVASFAILVIAVTQARQAKYYRERLPARYVAEAGMVWGQQNLVVDPTWGGGPLAFVIGGKTYTANVTVIPGCGAAPCGPQTVESKVTY